MPQLGVSGELPLLEKALRWRLQPQERGWSRVIQRLPGSRGLEGRQPDSHLQEEGPGCLF